MSKENETPEANASLAPVATLASAASEGNAAASSSLPAPPALLRSEPPKVSIPADPIPARQRLRVDSSSVTMKTEEALLPELSDGCDGLFGLLPMSARRALDLGLSPKEPSFHVFVAADRDIMIEDEVVRYAKKAFLRRRPPLDIVYVHDFDHPEAPRPLLLPAAMGPELVAAMDELVDRLRQAVPDMADAEEVRTAQLALARELEAKNKAVLGSLETKAKTFGFGVRPVRGGVQTFPLLHGKPVSPEQFEALDERTKKSLSEAEDRLTREVEKAAKLVRTQSAGFEAERDAAFADAARKVIDATVEEIKGRFAGMSEEVDEYFERVRHAFGTDWKDLLADESVDEESEEGAKGPSDQDPELATRLNRFKVNLLVTHDGKEPVPVIYETNPTYPKLFGYLERRARYGALLTDFTRIRAGSLHRASGGVLVVRAADLLADPIIWERMKRVLREGKLGAEDPLGPLGLYATTLRPAPVPIRLRVVLVGTHELYAALNDADADFPSLFRVKVEVESSIPRTPASLKALDGYLMAKAHERGWGPFEKGARARLLDFATRIAADRDRLAIVLAPLEETAAFATVAASTRESLPMDSDLEVSFQARPSRQDLSEEAAAEVSETEENAGYVVTASDVEEAWRERHERLGSAERHIRQLTLRGEVALDTSGTRVGVVNGLSVYSTGDVEFGQPMRITAVVALGREGIIDVEREAQLGGAIHTKGVAILRGYLSRMFGQERPLSLKAQLAFEQSYGEIDGDSASSSELFAVLSALADVGIDQGIAVTGSVNQLGEMQAIGGVCAKIEGFFDLCQARGLSGGQGVLLPKANLPHLVVRQDVAAAIERGAFHLYAVETVADGIELLTGIRAGERDANGRFPADSVFGRVERRIIEIAERLRQAEGHGGFDGGLGGDDMAGPVADGPDFCVR